MKLPKHVLTVRRKRRLISRLTYFKFWTIKEVA